jgi:hypothetical protein
VERGVAGFREAIEERSFRSVGLAEADLLAFQAIRWLLERCFVPRSLPRIVPYEHVSVGPIRRSLLARPRFGLLAERLDLILPVLPRDVVRGFFDQALES